MCGAARLGRLLDDGNVQLFKPVGMGLLHGGGNFKKKEAFLGKFAVELRLNLGAGNLKLQALARNDYKRFFNVGGSVGVGVNVCRNFAAEKTFKTGEVGVHNGKGKRSFPGFGYNLENPVPDDPCGQGWFDPLS